MSAVLASTGISAGNGSRGVWSAAATRFRRDRVGVASFVIVALFLVLVLAAAVGLVAKVLPHDASDLIGVRE